MIYQVYPRSFADSNGDGMGDLPGITSRLPYLRDLGVDALWISPFYPSPQADAGYDVADYCDVDPLFGSLDDAKTLIARAHELGLRVFVDIVPNHTSHRHPWFQRALAAGPGSPDRDWYIFRDGDPVDPDRLPNDWPSEFGGPAWSKSPDGQWYLHLFDSAQPDLNWEHPGVRQAFLDILRFWLDLGIDGFRVDVAHALIKAEGLPDSGRNFDDVLAANLPTGVLPWYDQDRVHEIYRTWRKLLDSYPGDRAMVAEAWVWPCERLARYVRPDEFNQAFNFIFMAAGWNASQLRKAVIESYAANDAVGAPTTWVLSNHDVVRHATRLGFTHERPRWLRLNEPAPDLELGLRRAHAATLALLSLPGSTYLYQGEELGLPEVIDLPAELRQDPTFHRTRGERAGRDGCRVPLPWEKDSPAYGFGPNGKSWLPQPECFAELAANQQIGRAGSTFELYRSLLALRRERGLGSGSLNFVDLGEDILAFDVTTDAGRTRVVVNLGVEPWSIPTDATVLIASDPAVTDTLATDRAVWLV